MIRILFLGLLLLAACGGEPPAKLNIGAAAPAFRSERLDGGAVDFPAAMSGRPSRFRSATAGRSSVFCASRRMLLAVTWAWPPILVSTSLTIALSAAAPAPANTTRA